MTSYSWHVFIGYLFACLVFGLFYFLGIDLWSDFLPVLIVVFVFSILPDIDCKNSRASGFLHLSSVVAVAFMAFSSLSVLIKVLIVFAVSFLEVYHFTHARSDNKHRQFPHSFTFGVSASLFAFLVSRSIPVLIMGFTAFASHLVGDAWVVNAFRWDKRFWKSVFRV